MLNVPRLCAVAFIVVAFGCGGGKKPTASDAGVDASVPETPSAACTAEANAVCMLRDSCAPNFGIARLFGTLALCESRTATTCDRALAANATGNTPATVATCAAAYPSEACTDFFDDNPVTACIPPVGTLAVGAPCGASAQCTTSYCAVPSLAICGSCAPLPAAGATCQVQADCGRDLACAIPTVAEEDGGIATQGLCQPFVAPGGVCLTGYHPCEAGFVCVGDDGPAMTTGICQAQVTSVGGACDTAHKTAANCADNLGLVCIPIAKGSTMGNCQAITLAAPGDPCGDIGAAPITGFADCAAGGLCKKAVASDTSGVCVAPAADGAACDSDPTLGPPCLSPAKCVPTGSATAGTCTLPNATTCM